MRRRPWRLAAQAAAFAALTLVCAGLLWLPARDLPLSSLTITVALLAGLHLGLKGLEKAWRLWRFRRGLTRGAANEPPTAPSRGPWLWPLCKTLGKAAIVVFVILLALEVLGVGASARYVCRNCAAYGAKRAWAPWIGRGATLDVRPTPYTHFLGLCQGNDGHDGHDCHDWLFCNGHGGFLGPMCMIGRGRHMLPVPLHEDETFFLFYLDSQSENLKERLRDYFRAPDAPASREFKAFFDQRYYEWRALHSARKPTITYD